MGIFQEFFNFDNIGKKIKNWAKWSCWITILLNWVGAIIFFFILLFTKGTFFVAFLVPIAAIIYSLLIWVGSWATYAFGEYIEDTKAIRYNTAIIAQPIRSVEAAKASQKVNKKPASPKPVETVQTKIFPARADASPQKAYSEGEYVSGRTYSNGDEVIFNGKKYICIAQGSTVWSPAQFPNQWDEIALDDTES